MDIRLCEITKETVRAVCALEVREEQRSYVAANALSLAQAHFEPSTIFRAICLGGQPIGFVQWRSADAPRTAFLWRFMIDRSYQAAGHGRSALASVMREMKASGFSEVRTSVVLGPSSPLKFYLAQGFIETNQTTSSGEWSLRRLL